MTVGELIEQLKLKNPERVVVMSKDGEGNGFSPLADVENASYEADTTWSGEIGLEELTPELQKQGYSEEDVVNGEPCIVLWPTN